MCRPMWSPEFKNVFMLIATQMSLIFQNMSQKCSKLPRFTVLFCTKGPLDQGPPVGAQFSPSRPTFEEKRILDPYWASNWLSKSTKISDVFFHGNENAYFSNFLPPLAIHDMRIVIYVA